MSAVEYDFKKLAAIDNLQIAVGNFSSQTAYFKELADFEDNARGYLRSYTPSVVVYSDDMRDVFMKEAKDIQRKLIALGMIYAASKLTELEVAACSGQVPELTDGLTVFFAGMDIMANRLAASRIAEKAGRPKDKKIILAVGGDQEALLEIVGALRKDFNVITSNSGPSALEHVKTLTPDLFLIDTVMQGMNGFELAGMLHAVDSFQWTPIMFVCGPECNCGHLIERGANFIAKPLDKEGLADRISFKLRQQSYH